MDDNPYKQIQIGVRIVNEKVAFEDSPLRFYYHCGLANRYHNSCTTCPSLEPRFTIPPLV